MSTLTACSIVIVVVGRAKSTKAAALVVVVVRAEAPESAAERHDAVYAAGARV
jgi:hypothetical protein